MMREQLTNEALKKNFQDNFALTRFIINAARYLVKSGHQVEVPELLKEIQKNPSLYEPDHLALLEKEEKIAN